LHYLAGGDLGTRSSWFEGSRSKPPTDDLPLAHFVREGLADIATGIRDWIRDIRHEVRAAVFSDINARTHAAVPLKV
jgi:hypothetical protein